MTEKKGRNRVMAEITLSHLLRLANEQGCPVSREQALEFLNHEGHAYEMWKHMMQAGENFIQSNLLRQRSKTAELETSDLAAVPDLRVRAEAKWRLPTDHSSGARFARV